MFSISSDKPTQGAVFDTFARAYRQTLDADLKWSGESSRFFARAKVELMEEVSERFLGKVSGLTCLDLGCGTGLAEEFLVGRFGKVVGVDVSAEIVAVAQRRVPGVEFRHYEPGRLPYEDGTFDVSFCFCVFHHVQPLERAALVAEMKRVTRPGGLLFTFEHNPLNPVTRHLVKICPFDEDAVLMWRGESRRLFEAAGLDVVASRYYMFFPGPFKFLRPLERLMGWVPAGGQYFVAARRR